MPGEFHVRREDYGDRSTLLSLMDRDGVVYSRSLAPTDKFYFGPGKNGYEKYVRSNQEDMQKQADIRNGTYKWRPIDFFLMTGSNFEGWPAMAFWIALVGFLISTFLTGNVFLGAIGGVVAAMGVMLLLLAIIGIQELKRRSEPS